MCGSGAKILLMPKCIDIIAIDGVNFVFIFYCASFYVISYQRNQTKIKNSKVTSQYSLYSIVNVYSDQYKQGLGV